MNEFTGFQPFDIVPDLGYNIGMVMVVGPKSISALDMGMAMGHGLVGLGIIDIGQIGPPLNVGGPIIELIC